MARRRLQAPRPTIVGTKHTRTTETHAVPLAAELLEGILRRALKLPEDAHLAVESLAWKIDRGEAIELNDLQFEMRWTVQKDDDTEISIDMYEHADDDEGA